MECVLLGSGGMMPMPYRLLTSVAVRLKGHLYIFDAGEGAQIHLKKAKLGIKSLRLLAISHLHGDHCLGVPGLLMMRAQVTDPGPLTIIGPPGIERLITELREILGFFINYPIRFSEWHEGSPEDAYQDELVRIRWRTLDHTTLCLGYRLEEHPRPGKFRPEKADAMGVTRGPMWKRLQNGETLILENGVAVSPEQVMGLPRPGRSLCYAVDTRKTPALDPLCREVDLAFLDGMFLPEHGTEAEDKGHMTVDTAARVARRVGARKAVLVHISPRYKEEDLSKLEEAAAKEFPGSIVARDLEHYAVALREYDDGTG